MQTSVGGVVGCESSCVGVVSATFCTLKPCHAGMVRHSQIARALFGRPYLKMKLSTWASVFNGGVNLQDRAHLRASSTIHLHPTSPLLLKMADTDTDTDDTSDRQFTHQLEAAIKLYNSASLEECEQVARKLVNHHAIPLYHRTKALCILASIVEDDDEAESYYLEAEALWRMVRRASDNGQIENVDKSLDEIREELDDLKHELDLDEDWTEEDQSDADEEERAVAEAHGDAPGNPKDKANALGIVTNDLRKVILDRGDPEAGVSCRYVSLVGDWNTVKSG